MILAFATLGLARGLVFKDSPVPPPKDKAVAAANRLVAERDKKAREQMKKERRLK